MTEQMDCQKYRTHLDEWIDGELEAELAPAMEAHRNSCPDCAEETRRAMEAIELIRTLEDEVPVPLEAQAAWRSAVREEARQRRRHRFSVGMRVASSIAATFVLLVGCTLGFRSAGMLSDAAPAAQTASAANSTDNWHFRRASQRTQGAAFGANPGRAIPYAYVASDGGDDAQTAAPQAAEADLAAYAGDADDSRLLIRSVSRTIATDGFDAAAQKIRDLAEQYNGYLETDSVATKDDGTRTGEFIAVISALEADSFLQTIDHVGNVTYTAEHYEDASVTIRDASERMGVLEAEKNRLSDLIAAATSADEMSNLNALMQSTLNEIDSLQSENNRLSNETDNVRVSIRLEELYAATAEPTLAPGLSQRMGAAFGESAHNLQLFVHDMAVSLMIIAPFALVVLGAAVIVTVIVVIIRCHRRKKKKNS